MCRFVGEDLHDLSQKSQVDTVDGFQALSISDLLENGFALYLLGFLALGT